MRLCAFTLVGIEVVQFCKVGKDMDVKRQLQDRGYFTKCQSPIERQFAVAWLTYLRECEKDFPSTWFTPERYREWPEVTAFNPLFREQTDVYLTQQKIG